VVDSGAGAYDAAKGGDGVHERAVHAYGTAADHETGARGLERGCSLGEEGREGLARRVEVEDEEVLAKRGGERLVQAAEDEDGRDCGFHVHGLYS
jgi:hypothetical protein